MVKPRAPAGAVCSGIPSTGLHLAPPGERLIGGLCRECREEKARGGAR